LEVSREKSVKNYICTWLEFDFSPGGYTVDLRSFD
jgi:hypothetical protein